MGAKDKFCDASERCAEYTQTDELGQVTGVGFNCAHEKYCGMSGGLTAYGANGQYTYQTTLSCPDEAGMQT